MEDALSEKAAEIDELKIQKDAPSALQQNVLEQRPNKVEFRMDMDEIMETLDVPCKKIVGRKNMYMLAIDTKKEIEEIIAKLQILTKVTWSVKQTRKFEPTNVKKKSKKPITLFKRQYGCHMSTRTRAKTKKLRKKKSRNINCPAQLLVSIKTFLMASARTINKSKPVMFDKQFPCLFEFRHHHNHLVDAVDVLNTRPMGDNVKGAICKLLSKGHSCASAFHTLYTITTEDFGSDYKTKMADRHHFPRKNDIASIFKTHGFRERFDSFLEPARMIANLEDVLSLSQKEHGTLYRMSVKEDVVVICLCTPLMQRSLQHVSEIIFIDLSSDDFKEFKMYFVLTQSSVGALPIGCILTNKHEMSAFSEGMRLFFEIADVQPAVVLTSGAILSELEANNFFPNSRVLFSFYHALSSAWRSLYDTRHELARSKKESYYQLFREVVFADNEESLDVARQVLAVECANPKFLGYIDKMYEQITLWCLYYRQYLVLHDSDMFDYNETELSFRLFRLISRVALDRTKLFNLTQITDFICSAFEKYYKNRVLEIVLGKNCQVLEEKYGRVGNYSAPYMEDVGHHQYLFARTVPEILDEYYQVDMITQLCTCGMGGLGKHCEHVSEVLAKFDVFSPPLTAGQRAAGYFIATGVLRLNSSFERPDNLMEEHETSCSSLQNISKPNKIHEVADAAPDFETTKSKWMSYCNRVAKLMEADPDQFLPAVNMHLNNIKKYSSTIPMLIKGLYAGFPYMGDIDNLPPLTIIKQNKAEGRTESRNKSVEFKINPETTRFRIVNPADDSHLKDYDRIKSSPPLMALDKSEKLEMFKCDNGKISSGPDQQTDAIKKELPKSSSGLKTSSSLVNATKKTLNFEIDLGQLSSPSGSASRIFEIEKGVFEIAKNDEVAILDEKRGVFMIPMVTD